MSNLKQEVQQAIEIIGQVSKVADNQFSKLSQEQLNWKPNPEKWSIAQCLHHLIVSNQTYFPQFNTVISGNHKNTFYQNIKFLSTYFGSYLIKETGPIIVKPMKNPKAFSPSQSELPGSIVTEFLQHQKQLSLLIAQLNEFDLNSTIISSPALSIITYSVNDLLVIIAGHEQRHIQQAERIRSLLIKM